MNIPGIDSLSFTGTSIVLGLLLINELTVEEQAAVGSWFMLLGDVLATNSSWCGVLEARQDLIKENNNNNDDDKKDLDVINKAIDKLKEDIEALQKEKKSKS